MIRELFTKHDYEYKLRSDGTAIITGYHGSASKLVIPAALDKHRVTGIGQAFSGCDSLTSVTVPSGVLSIGYWAFSMCTHLTDVILPEGLTSIGAEAFFNCWSLASVSIPDSVKSIEGGAFSGCASLTDVTVPGSVTKIGPNPFANCTKLKEIKAGAGSEYFAVIDGVLFTGPDRRLVCCPASLDRTEYVIPAGTRLIDDAAFKGCGRLSRVVMPDSIRTIGYEAFGGCGNLRSVSVSAVAPDSDGPGIDDGLSENVPETMRRIGQRAFAECTSLEHITVPDGIHSIDKMAFKDCGRLRNLPIPEGVTDIGAEAFEDCWSLRSISIPNSVIHIGKDAFYPYGPKSLTAKVMNGSYALDYCKREGIRYACPNREELQEGYYITYYLTSNGLGGYHPVELCLHNDLKGIHRSVTDTRGVFVDFPGIVEGDWRQAYKGKGQVKPWMGFNFRLGKPQNDKGLATFFWQLQPDGRYWTDADGFGMEADEEIWLRAEIDREGRFLTPFQ